MSCSFTLGCVATRYTVYYCLMNHKKIVEENKLPSTTKALCELYETLKRQVAPFPQLLCSLFDQCADNQLLHFFLIKYQFKFCIVNLPKILKNPSNTPQEKARQLAIYAYDHQRHHDQCKPLTKDIKKAHQYWEKRRKAEILDEIYAKIKRKNCQHRKIP